MLACGKASQNLRPQQLNWCWGKSPWNCVGQIGVCHLGLSLESGLAGPALMVIHRVRLIVGFVSKLNDYHGLMLLSVTLSRLSAHYKLSLMVGSVQEECSLSSHSQAYRVHLSIQGCMRKERPNSMILSFLLFSHFCLLIYSFFSCILLMDYNLSPGFCCSYEGFSLPCSVPHICGYG